MHCVRTTALALAIALAPGPVPAQSPEQRSLGQPLARSADNFTDIVAAHELPDGRVLVVDLRESRIALIDFARGTSTQISRQGPGPLEYDAAFQSLSWLGDTVLVYGRLNFLKIAPDGTPAGRMASMSLVRGRGGIAPPRFADRAGRIYYENIESLQRNPDGSYIAPLRGAVIRWDPASDRADTVATILHRDPDQPLVRPYRPFPAKDGVAVLPDGRVVVIRAKEYRVEVWRNGRVDVRGPVIDVPRIPIGAAERDAFRDERSRLTGGLSRVDGPARPMSESERAAARRQVGVPDEAFPPWLPPIKEVRPTLVDPSGLIWVARSHRADHPTRLYDVFNDRGNMVKRVTVPSRGRIVGFGKGVLYVAVLDDDDVQWLEKYAELSLH